MWNRGILSAKVKCHQGKNKLQYVLYNNIFNRLYLCYFRYIINLLKIFREITSPIKNWFIVRLKTALTGGLFLFCKLQPGHKQIIKFAPLSSPLCHGKGGAYPQKCGYLPVKKPCFVLPKQGFLYCDIGKADIGFY